MYVDVFWSVDSKSIFKISIALIVQEKSAKNEKKVKKTVYQNGFLRFSPKLSNRFK